jgi:hypothetical protein
MWSSASELLKKDYRCWVFMFDENHGSFGFSRFGLGYYAAERLSRYLNLTLRHADAVILNRYVTHGTDTHCSASHARGAKSKRQADEAGMTAISLLFVAVCLILQVDQLTSAF